MLTRPTTCNNFSYRCVMIDAPSEMRDGAATCMPAAVPCTVIDVASGSGVNVLASSDSNEWAGEINAASKLPSLEETLLFACTALSCWSNATCDCHMSQALTPSLNVWPAFTSPALPQFPNQAPPRPQQLSFPDLFKVPHLGHP